MKSCNFVKLKLSLFMFFSFFCCSAHAHTQNGFLGAPASATDLYVVSCAAGSDSLFAQIADIAPLASPFLNVQVIKGNLAANTTDVTDNNRIASPGVKLKGGVGFYYLAVNKSGVGFEAYSVTFHCVSATGIHTGTTVTTRQNQ